MVLQRTPFLWYIATKYGNHRGKLCRNLFSKVIFELSENGGQRHQGFFKFLYEIKRKKSKEK